VTLLTWNHACAIGVSAMDHQHGILMDTMNELRLAAMQGAGRESVDELLSRIIELARLHFRSEEQLLEEYAYPGLEEHRADHRQMLSRLLESAQSMQRGDANALQSLLHFLRDWFTKHVLRFDRRYGLWLNERGVF
jgi:hemerythrin